MDIQVLERNDLDAITELQPSGWDNIMPTIEFYTKTDYCFPVKVVVDNKIAGMGTAIVHNDIAWLAHIIVHPDQRNKGIGRFITQTMVDNLLSKGFESIYLTATDLGEPVYRKIGFEAETEYLFYKDIKADERWSISKNIIPFNSSFKGQVHQLDLKVSGEDRMVQLASFLTGGYVYVVRHIVEGFYLPAFGEGLVVASSASAGLELMKFRLTSKENAVFPIDNEIASRFMEARSYQPFKQSKRMRLGKKRSWDPGSIYNRIGGNLG